MEARCSRDPKGIDDDVDVGENVSERTEKLFERSSPRPESAAEFPSPKSISLNRSSIESLSENEVFSPTGPDIE